jgi:hypothetical protein
MSHAIHNNIVSFIWSIADGCLLEETKDSVLAKTELRSFEFLHSTPIAYAGTGRIKVT